MIYIAIVLAAVAVMMIQARVFRKKAFEDLAYSVSLSVYEVFEGEEIYLYEEIRNDKLLPLPFLKVDTELPDGLSFHILEEDTKRGTKRDTYPRVIHSLFVLKSRQMIRRRWRVRCDIRGTYHLGSATLLADDVFGTSPVVKVIEAAHDVPTATVVVLPKAIDLERNFTASRYTSGDFLVQSSLLTDPLLKAGVRDYVPGDPMNRINWMQTAVRGSLMTNLEEFTNRHQFNIIMNMQARDIEKVIPGPPSNRAPVELCMTVVASILDGVAAESIPVRFICNTPPEQFGEDMNASRGEGDLIGEKVFVSPVFRGTPSVIGALRMLATLELMISVPIEKMLDHILANPYAYTSGGNIIFVSSYLDERMINFTYAMRRMGVTVIFYITSTSINAHIIPEDIEVHFRTYTDE
ncbi:MAG: DUF58 domain-containing protein [Clostridia bacterium]|nr:DUF58 domain-containing protein [Clostridia bacterium]MCR4904624.1 DUF58 domain-containing protein [Clostridiales bacterium]